MAINKNNTRITLTLPKEILETIDQHIKKQYINRTKWFVEASKDRIEKENKLLLDKVVKGNK
jgi:metal-responsive CopG/Arc/MetJ family transcriptional regulator